MKLARSFCCPSAVATAVLGAALLTACAGGGDGSSLRETRTKSEKASEINKQLGTEYLRQGNLALAKEKLERAEKYNPRDAEVHSVLALLYERLGIDKEVDKHYSTAVRLAPKDPQISNNYAVYLCRNGRTDDGVKRFLESARNPLYRTPELAYTNAGVCLRRAKRYDEAASSFSRALQIRASNAEAVFQFADMSMEQGDFGKARAEVDKYLATYDATPDLLLTGVRLTRAQGDRVGEEKYTRRLRVEFPASQQFRSLTEQSGAARRNPG
jgi:type IV pilus assembly protein PilF